MNHIRGHMDKNRLALSKYANTAADLAEAVKRDIMHNQHMISNDTVIKLNNFIIASNAVADMISSLSEPNESDPDLN